MTKGSGEPQTCSKIAPPVCRPLKHSMKAEGLKEGGLIFAMATMTTKRPRN